MEKYPVIIHEPTAIRTARRVGGLTVLGTTAELKVAIHLACLKNNAPVNLFTVNFQKW